MSQRNVLIEISNRHSNSIDEARIRKAVEVALSHDQPEEGEISIAVVDDQTIHELNRKYLKHDYVTDVLSFCLDYDADTKRMEGEVIVSADTAERVASEQNWPFEHELLLYIVHGTLHLVGFNDKTDTERVEMRLAEAECLAVLGIDLPDVDGLTENSSEVRTDRLSGDIR